jgi:hypothetical protein
LQRQPGGGYERCSAKTDCVDPARRCLGAGNRGRALVLVVGADRVGIQHISWADLPGWKLALGLAAIAVLLGMLVTMFIRGWHALARIVRAFWTMTLAAFGILAFVVAAGLFSRGFQWVVQSVPDNVL